MKGQKSKYAHYIDGGILLGVGVVFVLIMIGIFGKAGAVITDFLIGTFGYVMYAYLTAMILVGVLRLFNVRMPRTKWIKLLAIFLAFGLVILLFHVISSSNMMGNGYGAYLKGCYDEHNTAGGILGAIFAYPLMAVHYYFALVIVALLAIAMFGVVVFYDAWLKDLLFGRRAKSDGVDMQRFDDELVEDNGESSEVDLNVYNVAEMNMRHGRRAQEFSYTTIEEEESTPVVADSEHSDEETPTIVPVETSSTMDSINDFFARYKKGENMYTTSQSEDKPQERAQEDKPNVTESVSEEQTRRREPASEENISDRSEREDEGTAQESRGAENSRMSAADRIRSGIFNRVNRMYNDGEQEDRQEVARTVDDGMVERHERERRVREPNVNAGGLFETESMYAQLNRENTESVVEEDATAVAEEQTTEAVQEHTAPIDEHIEDDIYMTAEYDGAETNVDDYAGGYDVEDVVESEVEDLTATHDDINDLGALLRKKKAEKEARDRQELLRSHGMSRIEEEIEPIPVRKRAERSDKGGTHQSSKTERGYNVTDNSRSNGYSSEQSHAQPAREPKAEEAKIKPKLRPYKFPPISLLADYHEEPKTADIDVKIESLKQCLEAFKINAMVQDVVIGPTFTRIELQMQMGSSVTIVEKYEHDIAMNMQVKNMRMEIPIPGKNAFGIEIPNAERGNVGLKELITSPTFTGTKKKLAFALGKDCDGNVFVEDLTTMPHLLMAGATGAGKSVCLNSLLCSLVYKYTPDYVRLLLIDPKQVEMTAYDNIPHMLIPNAISNKEQALNALDWAIDEMELRYTMFRELRVKSMTEYNAIKARNGEETLPYLVIVVDEVGDYMVAMKKELESRIVRLTQKARAAGIILILATQRPSVDVITGTIKANLPSRMAFAVASNKDSMTILDVGGAEKLLRYGDMLYKNSTSQDLARVQGTLVETEEVNAICDYIRDNNDVYYDPDIIEAITKTKEETAPSGGVNLNGNENSVENDPKFIEALMFAVEQGSVSISAIQRRFGYGFPKAARIVDAMEQRGFVAKGKDGKKMDVLLDMATFRQMYGDTELQLD